MPPPLLCCCFGIISIWNCMSLLGMDGSLCYPVSLGGKVVTRKRSLWQMRSSKDLKKVSCDDSIRNQSFKLGSFAERKYREWTSQGKEHAQYNGQRRNGNEAVISSLFPFLSGSHS
ncbi:uncharacterized protein LOC119310001 isoform X1 [Triticum dicoccoides]|uniref:uncharacterized protein LOC119310001 isoform X1 n=1 Tax=Triticum dicoccoides TaxID=85692 RepID=UPI0018918ADF|nr:uncharacterized protein LOC119310001 isoform X1 [Triticum dicoccoides]